MKHELASLMCIIPIRWIYPKNLRSNYHQTIFIYRYTFLIDNSVIIATVITIKHVYNYNQIFCNYKRAYDNLVHKKIRLSRKYFLLNSYI